MATTTTVTAHIWLDERGKAWIDDTNIKVIEVALDMLAYGLNAEEIHKEHYETLSMAQIHAALAYYYDHKAAFDAEIDRQANEFDELRAKSLDSPGRRKLRAKGLLP